MVSRTKAFGLLFVLLATVQGLAQVPSPNVTAPAQAGPEGIEDPLGRTTPYGTVVNFSRAVEGGDLSRATEYLNIAQLPSQKQRVAQQLKRLMDLGLRGDLDLLSKTGEGNLNDGLPPTRERVGNIEIAGKNVAVILDRVQSGNSPPVWLFSADTLLNLSEFTEENVVAPWVDRYLPSQLIERHFWGIALYRWFFIPLFLFLITLVTWLGARLLSFVCRHLLLPAIQKRFFVGEATFVGPIRLLLFAVLMSIIANRFGVTLLIRQFWNHLADILIVVAVAWLSVRGIGLLASALLERLRRTGATHRIAAVQLFQGSASTLAVVAALLVILNFEGVNLTTVIAGLGIGGLAIAFAAQKTIENLFGTVMLVTDQPVSVGDFCRVGDTLGTVEGIGLRSTRIRTLGRTVVSVPNGQVNSMILENFALRDKVWFMHTIGLRHETTADQLRYVLVKIRKLLYEHPKVESTSGHIRFVKFGGFSLDLEIFAYVLATDYSVFLEIQEDLLLRVMDIIEASGTGVAIPSQTTYLAKDSGLDAAKSQAAVAEVQQWKDAKTLPFPDFPEETISQIQNTLEYPPRDSALHNQVSFAEFSRDRKSSSPDTDETNSPRRR